VWAVSKLDFESAQKEVFEISEDAPYNCLAGEPPTTTAAIVGGTDPMTPTRWYLPFFLPSTALMIGIALALLVAWLASRQARRAPHTIRAILPHGGPWRLTARIARGLAGALAALMLLLSLPVTATALMRTIESPYEPVDPASLPQADAIVVLSGSIWHTTAASGYLHTRIGAAHDRFDTGIAAWRAGRAPILAFGSGFGRTPNAPTEGPWSRDRAVSLGVPADAILVGGDAYFTSDEATHVAERLRSRGVKRVILCTSAFHMQRSIWHYEQEGFDVTPLPCHFLTRGADERFDWRQLIPSARALEQADLCFKEWLGRAAQAVR
jgi:uncharacterized SAM-binding protein YcdF (DUF218 family)